MTFDRQTAGIALLCDRQGNILQVIRDELGLGERAVPGHPLTLVVDRESLGKALSFLLELEARGAAFDWELNVSIAGQITVLYFAGAVVGDHLLVVAARDRQDVEQLYQGLTQIGHEQINALRAAANTCAGLDCPQTRQDSAPYDELSRLNNELVNLQRELAKKSAELERVRFSIDRVLDSVLWVGEDGCFIDANDAACRNLGYSRDDMLSKCVADIDPNFPREVWADHWEEMKRRGAMRIESVHQAKDGRTYPVDIIVHNMQFRGRHYNFVVARDITERKRAEEALRRERDLVSQFMETSPVAIVVMDRTGRIVFANAQVWKLTGLAREEVMERVYNDPMWRVIDDDGNPVPDEALPFPQVVRTGRPIFGFLRTVELPGGQRCILSMNAAPLVDEMDQVDRVVMTVEDVTERIQAQDALRQYAERLRVLHEIDQSILAAESAEDIARSALRHVRQLVPCQRASVALFDVETGQAEVLTVDCSGETTHLGEGARFSLDVYGEAIETLRQGKALSVEDVRSLSLPSPLAQALHADGVRSQISVPLVAHGELMGTLNLGSDRLGPFAPADVAIAHEVADELAIGIQQARLYEQVQQHAAELEQRVAERTAELWASETRFRTLFEQAAIGIALIDRDGRVVESNPSLQAMLGYEAGALRGQRFTEKIRHPDGGAVAADVLGEMMAGRRPYYRSEERYVREDGRLTWINLTVSLVRREDGEPQFAIAMVEDVTERKETQDALIQAEKLTIAGKLAASLAHEINNPLQSVIGCLGLAREVLAAGEGAGRYLDVAHQELRRVAQIVAQLRDLHRPTGSEEREAVDVNAMVEQVLTLTRKKCEERGVEVTLNEMADLPVLTLAPDRVRQVFLNLVLNALDAMPEGGQLRVDTARTRRPSGVRVSFSDDGEGIPPQVLPQVFDPFYSTKPDGLGLGLFISRGIVEQHDGHIEVDSQVGKGTSFTVWLPA